MKILSRLTKPLLILWLCSFSLLDIKSMPNLVICFGQDGHIELETASHNRCGNNTEPKSTDFTESNQGEVDHCGPCSDILLLSDFAGIKSYKSPYTFTPGSDSPGVSFSLPNRLPLFWTQAKPRILSSPHPSPNLVSIRTVRLLV